MLQTSISSLNAEKMTDKHIQPVTFMPPLHTLPGDARKLLR